MDHVAGNEGSYSTLLQRIDDGTDTLYSVTVEGRSAASAWSRRTVRLTLEGAATASTVYRWAALGLNQVETNNGWTYGNVAANNFVELKGSSVIDGDATAVVEVKNPANVTGSVTESVPPEPLDSVTCPAQAYGPAPVGATVDFNAGNGELKTSGGDVWFSSGTYYFTLFEGAGHFRVAAGDSVTIYVDGPVKISGTGIDNPLPNGTGDFAIQGCGADASQWDLDFSAGSDNRLVVYALKHAVNLKKGGFEGSFIGNDIKKATLDDLRYDTNLVGGGGGGESSMAITIVSGTRSSLSH